ncbi:hypothetical protein ABVT39_012993, partial [Epinephelus coioides]
ARVCATCRLKSRCRISPPTALKFPHMQCENVLNSGVCERTAVLPSGCSDFISQADAVKRTNSPHQQRAAVSRLLALLTGPRGAIKDSGQPWAASPIQQQSVTVEMKTPPGQLLAEREVKPVGLKNKRSPMSP